jgi:hypothetical protein
MAHFTESSRDVPHCVDQAIDERIDGLTDWLSTNCPRCMREQTHLDFGTRERAYWHYGYLVALRDVRDLLAGRKDTLN